MHLMIYFQLNDLEIGKGYNLNSEKVETWHGSSFDPHYMCGKVERIMAKTGCTLCTNWTISFKVQSFRRKLICYKDISFFSAYFHSRLFLHPTCNIQSHILKFQPFLSSFDIFLAFIDLF